MKIVSIQGSKTSGKTTTAVKLIKYLKSLNYKVAYLKLSPAISLDKKNSDTGRAKQAGANSIIARDAKQTFVCSDNRFSLAKLLSELEDDILIGENLLDGYDCQIFCAKEESELDSADLTKTDCICGIYSNCYLSYENITVLNANIEIEKIAQLLVNPTKSEEI